MAPSASEQMPESLQPPTRLGVGGSVSPPRHLLVPSNVPPFCHPSPLLCPIFCSTVATLTSSCATNTQSCCGLRAFALAISSGIENSLPSPLRRPQLRGVLLGQPLTSITSGSFIFFLGLRAYPRRLPYLFITFVCLLPLECHHRQGGSVVYGSLL